MHPLLTGQLCCESSVQIRYTGLPVVKGNWKRQLNEGYDTNYSTYDPVIHEIKIANKVILANITICEMMTSNKIRYNVATLTFLLVTGFFLIP
jgi:hypothetical protein